jgi:hypothetical protein
MIHVALGAVGDGLRAIVSAIGTAIEYIGIGPFFTLLGILSALIFPLCRERRQRRRQDDITLRGIRLYLQVLQEKVDGVAADLELLQLRKDELASSRTELGVTREGDPRVHEQEAAVGVLLHKKSGPGSFERANLKNHDAIERLFVSSELSDTKKRDAVLEFIRFLKGSREMLELADYLEYKRRLAAVLGCLAAKKGSGLPMAGRCLAANREQDRKSNP